MTFFRAADGSTRESATRPAERAVVKQRPVLSSGDLDKTCRLCAVAISLLLGRIGRWSGREIARSALSLARSAQAERDNESCFSCVQAAFIDL
ncbi:hypothetical protein EVAR_11674_1 [Eumeta japonica]|uniref:Uncharacterized protein n=1 Tax=Eumeta variegata TaxID=151549 RepID=A0A4C1U4Q6_EUMVA|nr:hypothetical protein EVAR_11674_1 [Eumeta japonica]